MKTLCLPLLLLFMGAGVQAQYYSRKTPLDSYGFLSLDPGVFFASRPGHNISTSFPYTTTSYVSGTRSSETFEGSLQGRFTSPAYMLGISGGGAIRHTYLDVGVGLFRENGGDNGIYLKGGFGYIIPLGGLFLRPTLDFYYLMGKNNIGTIDNTDKDINLLGHTAFSQYTVKSTDGDGNEYENTYDANHLDVNYQRHTLLANPKIAFTFKPQGKMIFSLEAGWMLQVAQWCNLQLEQTNASVDATYTVGKIRLDRNGQLNGPYAGINIGIDLNGKKHVQQQSGQ